MAAKQLIDPFDNPGTPAKPPLVDPFDSAEYAIQARGTGGAHDAAGGFPHGTPKVMDTDQPLSFMVRLKAGFVSDPQERLNRYAAARFPEMPENERRAKYGYVGGDPVYVGDSGSLMRENAGTGNLTGPGDFAGAVGKEVPPFVGSIVGGIAGGAPGAALGGAAGRAGTKLVGQALGDQQSAAGNAFQIAVEGFLDGIGWKIGEVIGKGVTERRLAKDVSKFNATDARRVQAMAKQQFGIDLTPAESSNLRSLIADQTRLGMGIDDAGDIIKAFVEKRAGQVDTAVSKYIGRPPAAEIAGKSIRTAAQQSIDDATAGRTASTRASYRMLDKANPRIPQKAFESIEADDLTREFINKAVENPRYGLMDTPRNSYRVIDRAGKLMGDEIKALKKSGKNYEASLVTSAKNRLLGTMDDIVPNYRDTRKVFANQSAPIEELDAGIEGILAGVKDRGVRGNVQRLFDATRSTPDDVAKLRLHFQQQGKAGEWDEVVNAYLRKIWQGPATKDVQGGPNMKAGANFRNMVFGTKDKRDLMRAAMGPKRFETFQDLMDVLEATGRVQGGQSITAFATEASKAERAMVSPLAGKEGGVLPGLEQLKGWWADAKVGRWRTDLAKAMTSPDSIRELEKLKRLRGSPRSKAAIEIVSTALTKAGVMVPFAGQPADVMPQQLQQPARQAQ